MEPAEIARLQAYLRKTFNTPTIRVVPRGNKSDSVEVNIGDEFVGVLFRDDEDGETSYDFHMTILEIDLE